MKCVKLSSSVRERLRCPACKAELASAEEALVCINPACQRRFPLVDGIPVLIDETASLFSLDDFVRRKDTTFSRKNPLEKTFSRLIPSISRNVRSRRNYQKLGDLLSARCPAARVLVVGGSILGQGMEPFIAGRSLELVESDVSFGPRTALISDAHDIPFADESFDGVIAQAVLEHVLDPYRCVAEIHRVLKPHGLVYAETPFIQQVHMGRYDFTRFTHLGHRRLFRDFEEIESGAACGPGMALAWSYQHFLLGFVASRTARGLVRAFAGITSFYLKYLDDYLIDRPATLDAASAVYFLGAKGTQTLTDRDLIKGYRGLSMAGGT